MIFGVAKAPCVDSYLNMSQEINGTIMPAHIHTACGVIECVESSVSLIPYFIAVIATTVMFACIFSWGFRWDEKP